MTIDGDLSGESVCVVDTFCNQAQSDAKPVEVFLRDATKVDQAGRALVTRLATQGAHVTARGVYTSYLLQTLTCSS